MGYSRRALAQYHGWTVVTDPSLKVKHLKPTGATYSKAAKYKQGQALENALWFPSNNYCLDKIGMEKRSLVFLIHCLQGYFKNRPNFIVTKAEGKFATSMAQY